MLLSWYYQKKYNKYLELLSQKILDFSKKFEKLSDQELFDKTQFLKDAFKNKTMTEEELMVNAFSVVIESLKRHKKISLFKVQIMGAIVLDNANVAEMKTGEGKSFTALLPAYLNVIKGKYVYLITVNEYLVKRDYEEHKKLFEAIDVSIGYNSASFKEDKKKEQFSNHIVYTTNSELCFDYLRDNLVFEAEHKTLNSLDYCIVDEVDSILIDEAKVPLIISSKSKEKIDDYKIVNSFVVSKIKPNDYEIEKESKQIHLTKTGIEKAESYFQVDLFNIDSNVLFHKILNCLKAHKIFKKNIEYVVKKNKIVLIDQFTGRFLADHSYSDGLHQALQAKEKIKIEPENKIISTITYQNFFRLFKKLSGMTGTAKTEEEEIKKIYNMKVIQIPTNKPCIRNEKPSLFFKTKKDKYDFLINEVEKANKKGQPVLIGTPDVHSSFDVSLWLKKNNLKHQLLNATNHTKEAKIIENAGKKFAITVATNMAGRGTDIKLGPGVVELGGLYVIGVEKHETRRIDNQLIGRSARQGDPGVSLFLSSLEDELIVRFGGSRLKTLFSIQDVKSFSSKFVDKLVKKAQQKIEFYNFQAREELLKYNNYLFNNQEIIFKERSKILLFDDDQTAELLKKFISSILSNVLIKQEFYSLKYISNDYLKEVYNEVNKEFLLFEDDNVLTPLDFDQPYSIKLTIEKMVNHIFEVITSKMNEELNFSIVKKLILQIINEKWIEYLNTVIKLKHNINLKSYGSDPVQEFVDESIKLFGVLKNNIAFETIKILLHHKV